MRETHCFFLFCFVFNLLLPWHPGYPESHIPNVLSGLLNSTLYPRKGLPFILISLMSHTEQKEKKIYKSFELTMYLKESSNLISLMKMAQ